jgi:transposase IS481 family protein
VARSLFHGIAERLVNALVAEEDSMTALCEEYGVSRKTGYKWLARAMWLKVRAACRSGGQDRGECRGRSPQRRPRR